MKYLLYHPRIDSQLELMIQERTFGSRLGDVSISDKKSLLLALLESKDRLFFAESHSISGWTEIEQRVLGGLGMAIDVDIFDDGTWHAPSAVVHAKALRGSLLFCPGPLLSRQDCFDYRYIAEGGRFNELRYREILEERLLPLLYFINEHAKQKVLVRMPGIGCGVFAGPFTNMFDIFFEQVCHLLRIHSDRLANIAGVYFLEYVHLAPSKREELSCGAIKIIRWQNGPSLLAHNDMIDPELRHCHIAKCVAWDHFSWPGNDFFANSRHTDDGVSAAATNVMETLLPNNGGYHYQYEHNLKKFLAYQQGTCIPWGNVSPQQRLGFDQHLCLPLH